MARTVRDASIGTREARLKLKPKVYHWRGIHQGLHIGYRRGSQGSGTWSARLRLAKGGYALRALGSADDHGTANDANVLDFSQAQRRALKLADEVKRDEGTLTRDVTVAKAAESYMDWFRKHRRSARETEATINTHILPALGARQVAALKTTDIREWHETLAAQQAKLRTGRLAGKPNLRAAPKTQDQRRARQATANRILTVLKALLNRAFSDETSHLDDSVWRKVKPFKNADQPRIRFLTDAEAMRLVNACPTDLRALVRGALLTGLRYGEIVALRATDVTLGVDQQLVFVGNSKSGKPRHVPLNPEGVALFRRLLTGKTGDALVFTKADGEPWGKNHSVRPLALACKAAKVKPAVSFHELRHTFASHLAQAGVDLLTISKLLGHADTRITSRHYAHLADKTLADAVLKLPSFGQRANLVEPVPARKESRP